MRESPFKIKKISDNKYRVYAGTYTLFNTMKKTYFIINKLWQINLNLIDPTHIAMLEQ